MLQRLPEPMVPAHFVFLDELPLTPNGKVDRQALPEVDLGREHQRGYVPPANPTEEMLAGIWAELLGQAPIGANDNFFELGGHSLLATQMASRIHSAFRSEISLDTIFETRTLRQLAEQISAVSRGVVAIPPPLITSQPQNQTYPLSFAQERLWFLEQLEPGQPFNNIPLAIRIKGILSAEALEFAFNEIVQRQAVFRTSFIAQGGRPEAVVSANLEFKVEKSDLSNLSAAAQIAEVHRIVREEARRPFDLRQAPLLRAKLLTLGTSEHLLVLNMHHIISDGWSLGIFYRELTHLYEAFLAAQTPPLPSLPIQYSDYAVWQHQCMSGAHLEQHKKYWQNKLKGPLPLLDLPADFPRPALQTYAGATLQFVLPKRLTAQLKDLGRRQDATLFMILMAGFQALLHRYSGQEDILVGSPIAGRTRKETETVIGMFLNTLVFRGSVDPEMTFNSLVQQMRKTALEAYAHQDFPFEKLVETVQVERDLSRPPIFQAMFVLQNAPLASLRLSGLELSPEFVDSGTAKFDLSLIMEEKGEALEGYIEYNTALFRRETMERLLGHFETLLAGAIENPDQIVAALPLLTSAEREELLVEWNHTETAYPHDKCVHHLFEEQAARTPNAVALVFEECQLTYSELNARANVLARKLIEMGVGPETRVGICARRSLEMVVGLIAIHKAGAAHVPLDPSYPKDRLAYMLEDSQAPVLLTQRDLAGTLMIPGTTKSVYLEESLPSFARNGHVTNCANGVPGNPNSGAIPDNLAYVIYTSGSTGKPKGVMVRHRNVVNFFTGMDERLGREPGVWLAVTSISFDISVLEIFWTLTRGFKVIIQSEDGGFRAGEQKTLPAEKPMDFSLFYFSSNAEEPGLDRYRLLIE
ncbi:MAG TPA: condensation domain-containing protein, partial [Verrucomicrobiae bacterium]